MSKGLLVDIPRMTQIFMLRGMSETDATLLSIDLFAEVIGGKLTESEANKFMERHGISESVCRAVDSDTIHLMGESKRRRERVGKFEKI